MPATVRSGSTGNAVTLLQAQLNLHLADEQPPLRLDGIFGAKTLARVHRFQRPNRLTVDGIVGPKTWDALLQAPAKLQGLRIEPCGNGDPANQARALSFASSIPAANRSSITAPGLPSIGGLTRLAGSQHEPTARKIYGNSLDYDNIFLSTLSGAQGRAFTAAVPVGIFPTKFIQVLNVGNKLSDSTLIHELAHAWQSQHHSDPKAFMTACAKCQGDALQKNVQLGLDPRISGNPDFPTDFPFSAYGYKPGLNFGDYGGEQVAQQVQRGEAPIVSKVAGTAKGVVDTGNVSSLQKVTNEDVRAPGVKT